MKAQAQTIPIVVELISDISSSFLITSSFQTASVAFIFYFIISFYLLVIVDFEGFDESKTSKTCEKFLVEQYCFHVQ